MAGPKLKYNDKQYYAGFEGRDDALDDLQLGYYQRSSLQDIMDNFVISYVGDDKVLNKVPDYEIAFWAQRGLQEFSYDVLHSEKSIEIELGPALQFPLPQDYVNYVKVSAVADDGIKIPIYPVKGAINPQAPMQDGNFNYTYDSDDKQLFATNSESIQDFQADSRDLVSAQDYYNNNYNHDNFSYFNKRYGSNPEDMRKGGGFYIDTVRGIIFFDGSFADRDNKLIVLEYISDGLADSDDLTKVYVPKLAEDALYSYILYNLVKLRPSVAQLAPLYKKEAAAKLRNAKIRLTNYRSEELAQVLRNKAKWIKH